MSHTRQQRAPIHPKRMRIAPPYTTHNILLMSINVLCLVKQKRRYEFAEVGLAAGPSQTERADAIRCGELRVSFARGPQLPRTATHCHSWRSCGVLPRPFSRPGGWEGAWLGCPQLCATACRVPAQLRHCATQLRQLRQLPALPPALK